MTDRDDLEARLDAVAEQLTDSDEMVLAVFLEPIGEYEIDPETLEVVSEPQDDLPAAVVEDTAARGGSGVEVITGSDVENFENRLQDAVDALRANGGPGLDPDDVVAYIAARCNGDLPPGDQGIADHFDPDVTAAHLDQIREHLRRGA